MYNDTLKTENKIITAEDLTEIFQLMGETLKKYQKISKQEDLKNQMLSSEYQNYTFKDNGSKIRVTMSFYDNTEITIDNYDVFIGTFYNRISDIKSLNIFYTLDYQVVTPLPNRSRNSYIQTINMNINENKIITDVRLSSEDKKMDDIYLLLKSKILNAEEKYDMVIKKRSGITNIIAFAIGYIPASIITTLFLFIKGFNMLFFKGYVIYPIIIVILTFLIGNVVASFKLDKYYEGIMPNKKSVGWDKNFNRVYEDDIESYVNTSDILIGKKTNNLEKRNKIKAEYTKYKKYIPIELIILLITSIIVVIIGLFIK